MNIKKPLLAALLLSACVALRRGRRRQPPRLTAGRRAARAAAQMGTEYTEKGADTCLHVPHRGWRYPVFAIFKTKHASRADKRTPFARGCSARPATARARSTPTAAAARTAINSFKATSVPAAAAAQQGLPGVPSRAIRAPAGMPARTRATTLRCTSCHKIHAERDPVLAKVTQPEVCYTCHRQGTRGLHQAVDASGALRQDGLQRLPRRAWFDQHAGCWSSRR